MPVSAPRSPSASARELNLRCEAVVSRAMLAVARQAGLPGPRQAELAERIASADAALADSPPGETRMAALRARLGLSDLEAGFLWAAIATATDPRMPNLLADLAGGTHRRGMSVGAFAQLFELDRGAAATLASALAYPDHPAIALELLAVHDAMEPQVARTYSVATRLIPYLAGVDRSEEHVAVVEPIADPRLDPDQQLALEHLRGALAALGPGQLLVVEGAGGAGRRTAVALACGAAVVALDARQVPAPAARAAVLALLREAMLRDALPVIADVDALSVEARSAVSAALARWSGPVVMTAAPGTFELTTGRTTVRVTWPLPGPALRAALWREVAGADADDLELLAHRFPVGPGMIARAATAARLLHGDRPRTAGELAEALRHNLTEHVGSVARRVELTQSLDDLVVDEDIREQIVTLIARVRHAPRVLDQWGYRAKLARGTGIAALLSGPPGTGKSMTAGIVARELGLELYQVDLSQVLSKWVGETEKNLSRVFDAAEAGDMLLLFDEADALFAQRTTDVRGANDRHANLEVNYLLQRVEAFGGVTILTTNLDTVIDPALKRRLAAHIRFEAPTDEERTEIWYRMARTGRSPVARDTDFEALSHAFPEMTGANIRNAVLGAAFLAAAESSVEITQDHFLRAGQTEYRAMGRILAGRGRSHGL